MEKFLEKSIKIGLYLVLLTPFLFWKTFMYPFITLKVVIFQVLVEIIFLLWLILVFKNRFFGENLSFKSFFEFNLKNALLLLLAVLFTASVFGIDFQRSFFSIPERGLGLFALLHFFIFFLILSDFIKRKILDWRKYLLALFLISLVMAGLAFYQTKNPSFFFGGKNRPGGTLGNADFLANYLLFNFFIGLLLAEEVFRKQFLKMPKLFKILFFSFLFLGLIFLIYSIFLTESRGAILGLYLGLFFLLFYFSIFSFKKKNRIISALTLILFIFPLIFFWQTRGNLFWQKIPGIRRITNISKEKLFTQPRVLVWEMTSKIIKEKPVLGWGFENYRYAFDENINPKYSKYISENSFWDKPHNIFLEYLTVSGVLGLLAYLWIFVLAFWILFRKRKKISPFLGASLVSYLTANAVSFDTFGSYLVLFIVLGIIDSYFLREPREPIKSYFLKENFNFNLPSFITIFTLTGIIFYSIYFNFSILYFNKKCYKALYFFSKKDARDGIAEFKKALNPFYPYINKTRWNFAVAIEKAASKNILPDPKKNISWAVEELEKAVKSKPKSYFLNISLADMTSKFYQINPEFLKIAERASKKAIILSPKRAESFVYAAKIAFLKGKRKEAYDYIKKSVGLRPDIAETHFYLGLIALEIGKKEEGFRELKIAKEKGRDSRKFLESEIIANHFADEKKFKEAEHYYKRAIKQSKNNFQKAEAKLRLGVVYMLEKKNEEGRKLIKQSLKIYPEIKSTPFFKQIEKVLKIF